MPPYRQSEHPYTVQSGSQTDYPNQMAPQIIAHYKIQLDLQLQKLKDIEKSYKLKFEEIERRNLESQRQRQSQNAQKVYDESLERQVQNKKKQIQYLTRKLQNLRKMPLNILNSIDELLIPHESPNALINAKKKEIKQLQNELAQSENIFEGKYMIEHKLINEYETELALNKKLQLLREEKQVFKQKSIEINIKKIKNTSIQAQYKKKSSQMLRQIDQIKSKIKSLEGQDNTLHTSQYKIEQMQFKNLNGLPARAFFNKEDQNHGKMQNLQIQTLQFQLKQLIAQNQNLLIQKKQKDHQLQKITQQNQRLAEDRTTFTKTMDLKFSEAQSQNQNSPHDSFQHESGMKKEDFYSRTKRKASQFNQEPETSRGKMKEEENKKVLETQVKQQESLLESVIKFFSRRTRATEEKPEGERSMQLSRKQNQYTLKHSVLIQERQDLPQENQAKRQQNCYDKQEQIRHEKQSKNPREKIQNHDLIREMPIQDPKDDRQKVHEKYLAKIQSQSIRPNPNQGKYDRFDLSAIYKKGKNAQNSQNENKSEEHVRFDLN